MTTANAGKSYIDLFFNLRTADFGAAHPARYEAALDICQWADSLDGVGASVSLGEHDASSDGYLPSPIVLAAAIAGRTASLRTTITLLLPLYHPIRLAEDLAILDLVSGGRTDFLFAAGYLEEEFAEYGVDLRDRGRLMEEGIETIKAAWSGQPFEFRGAAARVTPRPLRQPRPPIAMAGATPAAARRAARMADSFAPTTNPALIDAYRTELERLGRDPGPRPRVAAKTQVIVGVTDDPDALWEAVGPHCLHEINMYAEWLCRVFGDRHTAAFGENPPYFESRDVDELRESGRYLVLTPQDCVTWARTHDGHLRIDPLVGGNEPERAWQALRAIETDARLHFVIMSELMRTSSPISIGAPGRRARALVPVLVFVALLVAVVSSLGAPLVPTIATDYRVSLGTAQWSLTIALLVGAVTAPVVGRLGDGPCRRSALLTALAAMVIGSVLAALPTRAFALFLLGRGMQGVGLGLVPLAMSVARDQLDGPRARSVLATLSVTGVAGLGLGYPTIGLVAQHLGFRAGFWMAAGLVLTAMIGVLLVVPSSVHHSFSRFDVVGAALLGLGLAALLIAISEAEVWGWGSGLLSALLAVAVVVLAGWGWRQLHTDEPLVDLRLLRHRTVLTANIAGLIAGVGAYMLTSMIIRYVQTPASVSYGLGASVVVAGFILVPLSAFSFGSSKLVVAVARWISTDRVLPLGLLVVAASLLMMATARGSLWEIFVIMCIAGVGVGSSFAVMPRMIVSAVPAEQTSSTLAANQVLRTIGYSIGSALSATILTAYTAAPARFPSDGGYTAGCFVAIGLCLLAALLSWVLPHRDSATRFDSDQELVIEEDVNAAISGSLALETGAKAPKGDQVMSHATGG